MTDQRYDIVVVGAGMVGAAFAALLATRQLNVASSLKIAILDAVPFQMPDLLKGFDPRVVALTEPSRQLLEEIGVWEGIVGRRSCAYQRMEVWEADGTGHIEFDCTEVRQPNLGHIVENSLVIQGLLQKIDELGEIQLICPAKVVGVKQWTSAAESKSQNDSFKIKDFEVKGIEIILDDGSTLTTKLLVAADGAQSKVRELCGFKLREWDYDHHAIVTTVTTENPHNLTARQRFLPTGPLAFLPLQTEDSDCHHCSIVWSQHSNVADSLMLLSEPDFCLALEQAGSHCLGKIEAVAKRYKIPLKQRHAVNYVLPGVALLGDAAHTIHPLAGQGVNLGFQDVLALVEEVERAVARGLSPGDWRALERYQRRRKPSNLGMMVAMEGFKRLFEASSLPIRMFRNEGMSQVNQLGLIKNKLVRLAMGLP